MSIVTNIVAVDLAVTGADPMPWWLWAIAGALVVLGIVFLLLRRRGDDDADEALAAPIIATVDPATGQGIAATTPVPTDVSADDAAAQIFKPTPPPADDAAAPEEPPTTDDGSDGNAGSDAQS